MTNIEKVVNIIITDIKNDLEDYYSDWEIENWKEYLDATGRDSADFKEDVYYMLNHAENLEGTEFNDDLDIYDNSVNGGFITYRQLMHKVRKEIGW